MKKTLPNQLRIIAGNHRGRKIPVPDRLGLRPSPNRVRETVFNWLQFELSGAHILDAFAGSGAMGLEALSRGAQSVLFCDVDSVAINSIQDVLAKWHEKHACTMRLDVLNLTATATKYDCIFLDPPFTAQLHEKAITKFASDNWLKPHGKIYIESPEPLEKLSIPDGWIWFKSSKAGQIKFGLLARAC